MDIVLQPSDKICAMCYKAHVAILKSLEEQLNTPVKKAWTLWEMVKRDDNTNRLTKTVHVLTTVLFVAKSCFCSEDCCSLLFATCSWLNMEGVIHNQSCTWRVGKGWLAVHLVGFFTRSLCT